MSTKQIEPLNIDDYYTRIKPLPDPRYHYVTLRNEDAIRALFEKQKEIIEVVNSLVEKKV